MARMAMRSRPRVARSAPRLARLPRRGLTCQAEGSILFSGKQRALFSRLAPKTELHLHLDGSLPATFIAARAKARGTSLPCPAEDLGDFARARERTTMAKSLKIFDLMNEFLQTEDELAEATHQILRGLSRDHNVRHAEIRFCPTLHTLEGLGAAAAVRAVQDGFAAVALDSDPGMSGGVIVCALRSLGPGHALEMAELAVDAGALAWDVAGDEQLHPLAQFEEAAAVAKAGGVALTPHAGEWPQSLPNLRTALDFGASRLGHGLELARDPELMSRCAEEGVVVECCMTANVGGNKVRRRAISNTTGSSDDDDDDDDDDWGGWYHDHPIRTLFDAGVKVCLNSDNLLVSGSTATGPASPTGELLRLMQPAPDGAGFTKDEVKQVLAHGIDAAIISGGATSSSTDSAANVRRAALRDELDQYFAEHDYC